MENFISTDFHVFYSLLSSGDDLGVVWLNYNIIVYYDSPVNYLQHNIQQLIPDRLRQTYEFKCDWLYTAFTFKVVCLPFDERTRADTALLDMMLSSLGLKKAGSFKMRSGKYAAFPFSSEAFDRFITMNEQLTGIELTCIVISNDICDIIGRILRLDILHISACKVNFGDSPTCSEQTVVDHPSLDCITARIKATKRLH
jgi:hypothetical protein